MIEKLLIKRSYKTELNPTNKQKDLFVKNAGTARFAYNWALNIKKLAMEAKTKIPTAYQLIPSLN